VISTHPQSWPPQIEAVDHTSGNDLMPHHDFNNGKVEGEL